MDYKKLADLLFPDASLTIEELEKKYPKRNLPQGAIVTRFGPSPTGFVHIGGLFVSLVDEMVAHKTEGVFYLRVEDTDKKREVEGGFEGIIDALANFNIKLDEGAFSYSKEVGQYGPYIQSRREDIYKCVIKYFISQGLAYPCFCSPEKLDQQRKIQESQGVRPGYYSNWASCRNLTYEQIESNINNGMSYVIRLKSQGVEGNKVKYNDLVKGQVEMQENDIDSVILKTDGLPVYHFAHLVDDHFMRTTHIIRGDEWLPSLPLHLELFKAVGWEAPLYAHISPIIKEEGNSRRKLSKRKDPEAAVSYFYELGFPSSSLKEYLLTLINSDFEDWRNANPKEPSDKFEIRFEKMSTGGSLFDMVKLNDVSKNTISRMTAKEIYDLSYGWASKYDVDFAELMSKYKDYTINVFNIERESDRPRKDIGKWSEVKDNIEYFYDELFNVNNAAYDFDDKLKPEDIKSIIIEYIKIYNENDDKDTWFGKVKELAGSLGFASDMKAYKQNPEAFKGNVADVAMTIRVALTKRRNTPDLYQMMQVMGKERVIERFKKIDN